ncbi:TIGR04283 family arsenosugar biosynthesis glycosyltransferase [Synoicihabitans lomoniglobus]|uniref:TIGR04283 family arsenosugar biosynthesis glycosyltransferase n=1 Tax=Synoicihabitans lomoniglobus TaxID=2909285 RepID=A0AAE9ZVZ4_9BACT|nr:TIGR04283 family arsenosugar biosynthesis glycosyltransferase [Opitutaceae bacterium LMO-M01]WED63880.1 TIGR04283 family arsenosugar biosynthesis glycosyltransferase [Opitutaceae bacterium LMO-M01]
MAISAPSVIIPTLNEAAHLPATLRRLAQVWPAAEVIVVDGGSTDQTLALAIGAGVRTWIAPQRGRGVQLHAGSRLATRPWLLFLHADTLIDAPAREVAQAYCASERGRVASFRVKFDDPHWLLKRSAWFTRFDSVFTRFGDQGILIRASYYRKLGGFEPWPLFEDVDLLQRARQHRPVDVLPASVTTSARRFRARGHLKQQLRNGALLLRFLAGADPRRLAPAYPPVGQLGGPGGQS